MYYTVYKQRFCISLTYAAASLPFPLFISTNIYETKFLIHQAKIKLNKFNWSGTLNT